MRGVGTAAAVSVVGGVGTVPAVAQDGSIGVDYDSSLVKEGRLEATVEIDELDLGSMSRFGYVADDGSSTSLLDDGFSERSREDDDPDVEGPIAHNPDSYLPSLVSADEFSAFPRGVTETVDDEEEDVSALDADQWTGTATVSDSGDGIQISGGDTDTTSFAHEDFVIDSGEPRKVLQLIINANDLTGTVDISINNSGTETPVVTLDTDADSTDESTVATATADGIVYQEQLGDLVTDGDIESIDELEISISGGSADIEITALNLDSESVWELGDQEVVNSDDEIEIETVSASEGGYLDVVSIESLGDRLSSATVEGVRHDVEQLSRDLDADRQLAFVSDSPSGYDTERRLTQGLTHGLPTAYDLSWSDSDIYLIGGLQESRYIDVGYAFGTHTLDDQNDIIDLSTTYIGDQLSIGAEEEHLVASDLTPGDDLVLVSDIVLSDAEVSSIESSAFIGGAAGSSGGGILGTARNRILALAGVVGAVLAWIRSGGS